MSQILNIVLMLGMVGGGIWLIMNRCTLLPELCNPQAAAAAAPADSSSTETTTQTTAGDNGKESTCDCCKCKQNSTTQIVCTTPTQTITYSGGALSLQKQCDKCNSDKCKKAKADAKKAADKAARTKSDELSNEVPRTTIKGLEGVKVTCAKGYNLNADNVCVKNGSSSNPKPSKVATGCKNNEHCNFTSPTSGPNAGKLVCTCSNYARAFYGVPGARSYYSIPANDPYKVFRNRISFK